jgi:hypothetical protein
MYRIFRNWFSLVVACVFFKTSADAIAQNDSTVAAPDDAAAQSTDQKKPLDFRLGPFDLHPRVAAGMTYDDNILFSPTNTEADEIWTVQPAVQAIAGDDAALVAYRDAALVAYRASHLYVLSLSPDTLIIQPPEDWPGKLFILDYGPRFQIFDHYSSNNSIDQLGTLNLLWPMSKFIFGLRQDYDDEKTTLVEAGQRTGIQTITTTVSLAYQWGERTSLEGDFQRYSVGYDQPGLTGYTEYNTKDWFNYEIEENLHASVGVIGGLDVVTGGQDQTFEQFLARLRYNYTEKLTFDASVGAEWVQYEDGNPGTLSTVFTVTGQYQIAERTTLNLTGTRQQYASIYNGYYYTSTGARLGVSQGITDHFMATLYVGYYNLDYTPDTTAPGLAKYTDDYWNARLGFQTKLGKYLVGQIFYQWYYDQTHAGGNVTDNQAGVQLTLGF